MPFPPSNREVYNLNPLEEVICQVRYPAILKVSAEPPFKFQDAIRDAYPLYEEKTLSTGLSSALQEGISELLAALPIPMPPGLREHHFSTEDKVRSISLTRDFIAVIDGAYTRWEEFRNAIKLAEETVREIYSPAFYQRVGLRYANLLVRGKFGMLDVPWSRLLNPWFIGMLGDKALDGDIRELTTESLLTIPDVEDGYVRIKHGLATAHTSNEQIYLIDADFHTNRRSDSNAAFHDVDAFNRWAGYLFRWATTPELRDALGKNPIEDRSESSGS